MKKKTLSYSDYKAEHITVLDGLEPVRKRPGMYIGSTGSSGLHHLLFETLDNSVDEAMAGFCNEIWVILHKDGKATVIDNGRGIPTDIHPQTKKSALETVMCTLHAGGKFDGVVYKVSGGLHGVGVSVVNALSSQLTAEVAREGKIWSQEYSRGKPISSVKKLGEVEKLRHRHPYSFPLKGASSGTKITFQPDPKIFETLDFNFQIVLAHCREQAYLTKGVKIKVIDERDETSYTFYFEGGIISYIKHLLRAKEPILEKPIYIFKEGKDKEIEIAFIYTDSFIEHIYTFANNINTPEGGTHLTGFKSALTRVLNDYAKRMEILKNSDEGLSGEDVREGIVAIVSCKVKNPQFEGQTKQRLGNPEVKSFIEESLLKGLSMFLEENPQEARKIIEKSLLAQRARKAAKAARETVIKKGILEGLTLPGKLADCSSKNPEECEVYIVEGDSAGGCFSGDTKVALTDGRNLTFKELVKENKLGKKNYCYTIQNDGSIGIELIKNPRKTKSNVEVMKIILDNGEEIVCTPDHKFMLKNGSYSDVSQNKVLNEANGSYKKAKNLILGDSLMPLRRQFSKLGKRTTIKDYELVWCPKKERWIFTHLLADEYNLKHNNYSKKRGDILHHIDFNKQNNNPDNLIRMSKRNYLLLHVRLLDKIIHREDVKEKTKKIHKSKIYREKIKKIMNNPEIRKILSEGAKKQWKNEEYGEITKEKYDVERLKLKDENLLKYDTVCHRFFENDENKLKEVVGNYNHKVKKIIKLKKRMDVYDLEVPKTHNFALASGIFVHNSAKQARDRKFQAILPLRGKILNVEKSRLDKILSSSEIKALIVALGCGISDQFDISRLRYHRIIIMTDADVDGSHIRTLLLTFFFRYMPEIIKQGHLYIAQPPLYKIEFGKEVFYAYTDEDKETILSEIKKASQGKNEEEIIKRVNIQRYKGLGEMNPSQLWETTMNPENRVLLQVSISDAQKADEIFSILMGGEVFPRKKFIQTHATKVKNLDV